MRKGAQRRVAVRAESAATRNSGSDEELITPGWAGERAVGVQLHANRRHDLRPAARIGERDRHVPAFQQLVLDDADELRPAATG